MKIFGCRTKIYIALLLLTLAMFLFLEYYEIQVKRRSDAVSFLEIENRKFNPRLSKYKYNPRQHQNYTSKIILTAQKINERGLPVLVSLINNAYLPFAYSWLCNTMYMGIHKQVLFIVTDASSQKKLKRDWPQVTVVSMQDMNYVGGAQEFSRVGYLQLMVRRTEIILSLLKQGIEMLLFEVDCIWFSNPIPECKEQSHGYEIVASAISERKGMVAAGFLYMVPTQPLITFWNKLTNMMKRLGKSIKYLSEEQLISENDNDQTYFNRLIKDKYAGVKVNVLPFSVFADGLWYKLSEEEQENMRPLIINNNWIKGNKNKIHRAKKFGHWFWKGKSWKCDKRLVNDTLY